MVNAIARTLYFHNSTHDYGSGIYTIARKLNYDVTNAKPSYSYMGLLSIAQHLIDNGFFTPPLSFGTKAIQQTIRLLAHNWASYWGVWKAYKRGTLSDRPSIPGYLRDYAPVIYNNQMISKKLLKQGIVGPMPTVVKQGLSSPTMSSQKTFFPHGLSPGLAVNTLSWRFSTKNTPHNKPLVVLRRVLILVLTIFTPSHSTTSPKASLLAVSR